MVARFRALYGHALSKREWEQGMLDAIGFTVTAAAVLINIAVLAAAPRLETMHLWNAGFIGANGVFAAYFLVHMWVA